MQNVRELIETRAGQLADKIYLHFEDQSITFGGLNRDVDRVAQGLSRQGVGKGDRVAVLLKNSPGFIWVWWAILKLGAVMVPVNLRLIAGEAAYIIDHSEATAAVVGAQSLELLPELMGQCPGVKQWLGLGLAGRGGLEAVEDFLRLPGEVPAVEMDLDSEAVILYTSGTTGFPKGVIHTHGNYLRTGAGFARTCGLSAEDRLLTANPLFHVNAQFYSCLGTLYAGATFILAEKFSASRMWEWTRRYQANKVVMLLALTTILYNRDPQADDADNPVELVVAGGAPKGHYHDFETRFGVKLQTLYSLTESPLAVMSPLTERCVDGAIGLPMTPDWPGLTNEVKVFGPDDQELEPGRTGQIVIRNQALFRQYLKNPEATAEAMAGGWLHTGDLGRTDERGWVYFLGRGKDVIRKKGENISAVEVENALNAAEPVAEAAVIGVSPPDAAGEEEIMAFVVKKPGAASGWQAVIDHCRLKLADFKVPRFWLEVEALPKNAMNRVVKKDLTQSDQPENTPGTYDLNKDEVA